MTNAVVYDTARAFRYKDDIQNLKIWNGTIGDDVTSPFQAAASGAAGLEVRNLLVLGTALPLHRRRTRRIAPRRRMRSWTLVGTAAPPSSAERQPSIRALRSLT